MRIHWLVKYYLVAFLLIFSIAYFIDNSEPYVNWELYPELDEKNVYRILMEKNCSELNELYKIEYNANYKKNILGFVIRKDKKSMRGLNLLKFLNYNMNKINCA